MTYKTQQLLIDELNIDVIRKDIKNIYLRVNRQDGRTRVSAPVNISWGVIQAFVESKRAWIRKQQQGLRERPRKSVEKIDDGERLWFLGESYSLRVIEVQSRPGVEFLSGTIQLSIRKNTPAEQRLRFIYEWYRAQLKLRIPAFIQKYQSRMSVNVKTFGVKRMKTRWGSCNPAAERIWLNLELAKRPLDCLEYVIVHEMAHLIERRHNKRFYDLMDRYLPEWRNYKQLLNSAETSAGWKRDQI